MAAVGRAIVMTSSRGSKGLASVAAATAVVFVAGKRVGSAVLVDERRLLTAGHVLPGEATPPPPPLIEVAFPFAPDSGGARVAAERVDLAEVSADVGMLNLVADGDPRPWLPSAVSLCPALRLPDNVSVFGFPRAERELRGVWREFVTAGPAADGTVQLNWAADAGTLPGHSGGPVVDPVDGALVGVLVQGSEKGHFDRFVPLGAIRDACPWLPFPWLMAGNDARGHFTRRSRGQRSRSRGGDLFRGRDEALARVSSWLTSPVGHGRPLVVTGQPGAGKSAVLARAALRLEAGRTGPGLVFHARDATHDDLLTAVADLTGAERSDTQEKLLESLEDRHKALPIMIAVDALDEAASARNRRQIAETLTELAGLPWVRVVVATRPLASGDRYADDGLFSALGVTDAGSMALVDLDTDRYFDPTGLRQFAAAVLIQQDGSHPGPAGAAWSNYRANSALCNRLAAVIGNRSGRNYLVAALAAVSLSVANQPVDPAAPGFDPASIPSKVGEAIGKYLEQLPEHKRSNIRALLTVLAYARGDGIDDRTWMSFAGALGYPIGLLDLDQLRAGTAADYLLETVPDDDSPLTRLFHQALADELLARRRDRLSDERALLAALRPATGTTWATASRYALVHAAEHASAARQLLDLINDPQYLTHASLARLPLLISLEPRTATSPVAAVIRQVAARADPLSPARRARLLTLAAAHFGLTDLRRRLADTCGTPFTPVWAHSLGAPHTVLLREPGLTCMALGRVGDDTIVAVGCRDGSVRVYDAATGRPLYAPLTGHTGKVEGLAIGRASRREVIASCSEDGTIRVWDAAAGEAMGEPLKGHIGRVSAVATGRVGGRDVIVSGGDDGTVRVWDATDHTARARVFQRSRPGHSSERLSQHGPVMAVVVGQFGGRDVIIGGDSTFESAIVVWDAATGQPLYEPLTGHARGVSAVTTGRVGECDVIVSGGWDNSVRLWDGAAGLPLPIGPLTGHDFVSTVAIAQLGGQDIIMSGGYDGAVRLRDPFTGQAMGQPLTGISGSVLATAAVHIDDHEMIVAAGQDGTVRVWDATQNQVAGEPITGHAGPVHAAVSGQIGGRDVIVSGSADNTVRRWDAVTGRLIDEPLVGHTGWVHAVAIGRVGNTEVIVSGSSDGTVRLWEAATGQSRVDPVSDHFDAVFAVAIRRVDTVDVIAATGSPSIIAVRSITQHGVTDRYLDGVADRVSQLALGRAGQRDVIVSGGSDGSIRTWGDADSGIPCYESLIRHDGDVSAFAVGRLMDHDIIVSSSDHLVRVWDAVTGKPLSVPLDGHTGKVTALAVGQISGQDVIVSGSWDQTVRIWDAAQGRPLLIIDLLGGVSCLTLMSDGSGLCVGTGHTLSLFAEASTKSTADTHPL